MKPFTSTLASICLMFGAAGCDAVTESALVGDPWIAEYEDEEATLVLLFCTEETGVWAIDHPLSLLGFPFTYEVRKNTIFVTPDLDNGSSPFEVTFDGDRLIWRATKNAKNVLLEFRRSGDPKYALLVAEARDTCKRAIAR